MIDEITTVNPENFYRGQLIRVEPSPDLWVVVEAGPYRFVVRRARWYDHLWSWLVRLWRYAR